MGVDEQEALAGLKRSEEKLRAYADERNLVVRIEQPWPGALPPEQQPGPIKHAIWSLAGRLPGGAVGRLRHQAVFGTTFGIEIAGQHTIMVCRLPESVGYVPMVSCRPAEFGAGLFHWAGDQRPRQSAEFESVELGRRYLVEVAKGQDQNWLHQLFSPSMIDWLASETPQDFGFRLDMGVFTAETPQWRGQARADGEVDPAALDLLAESGGRAAGRIRDEVLEEEGLGADPDSIAAYAARAGAPAHGRIVGAILKLAGAAGGDDSVAEFAEERGLQTESPAEFHARHLRLPLPGAATDVVTGVLPGGLQGSLAWIAYSSDVDMERNYIALVATTDVDLPAGWMDAEDVGVPGAGEGIPPAALAAATEAGFGISTAGRSASVYAKTSTPGTWPSSAQIDAFVPRAAAVIDGLG